MKVLSAVLLAVASSTVCEAFAPVAPSTFARTISANTFVAKPSNTLSPTKTALSAVFESADEIEMDAEERMGKTIENVKMTLNTIRTGRASPSILDLVQVEYYGAKTPLNQIASISVPNSQQLSVSPFDRSIMGDIERAIIESGLGLTPNNDGDIIRINIPPITEDRRKELMKKCKSLGEDGKVAIRNVRRDGVDAVKKLEKAADISEDQSKDAQDSIQKLTDTYVKEIDTIVSKKEKEVMTV